MLVQGEGARTQTFEAVPACFFAPNPSNPMESEMLPIDQVFRTVHLSLGTSAAREQISIISHDLYEKMYCADTGISLPSVQVEWDRGIPRQSGNRRRPSQGKQQFCQDDRRFSS